MFHILLTANSLLVPEMMICFVFIVGRETKPGYISIEIMTDTLEGTYLDFIRVLVV